ncbi:hypothetical protein A2U11_10055 [Fusobacterium necrophorum subsp. funduliforme]|uniref:hypothetical protein n=1 Tax=Fusobacterium necrophorum TaxID=859 RepID=UPI000787D6F9|nr:hypothetical protein [Fusobacterium necrophorum]KYM49757.1 hypothetical protein A2U11_10055 [Fusobacterium necrophorum subsp. funduliforme]
MKKKQCMKYRRIIWKIWIITVFLTPIFKEEAYRYRGYYAIGGEVLPLIIASILLFVLILKDWWK